MEGRKRTHPSRRATLGRPGPRKVLSISRIHTYVVPGPSQTSVRCHLERALDVGIVVWSAAVAKLCQGTFVEEGGRTSTMRDSVSKRGTNNGQRKADDERREPGLNNPDTDTRYRSRAHRDRASDVRADGACSRTITPFASGNRGLGALGAAAVGCSGRGRPCVYVPSYASISDLVDEEKVARDERSPRSFACTRSSTYYRPRRAITSTSTAFSRATTWHGMYGTAHGTVERTIVHRRLST